MIKIFILTHTLNYGGATKVLIDIANFLSTKGYSVSIINYGKKNTFYDVNQKIEIININSKYDNIRKLRRLIQMVKIRRLINRRNPNLVIAFANTAKLISVFATIFTKTKTLISERQDPYNYKKKRRNMYFRYMLSDGIVFQTDGAANYFPKSVQRKSKIIPNAAPKIRCNSKYKNHYNFKKAKKQIAFVARFEIKQKRQDIMVKAFSKVHQKHPEYVLNFYGDGPNKAYVVHLVKKYGLTNNVFFKGVIKDIRSELLESKMLVLTSDFEGIPNVLMEAMVLGIPVISTNCSPGGAKLIVNDKTNGLLVPVGDDKRIAEAISFIINNPEFATQLGIEGIRTMRKYDSSLILSMWEKYINNIIEL